VIDFIAFRDNLAKIVKQLDHHMLLPLKHSLISVEPEGEEITVRFKHKRWVFPAEDCMLLPIVNTTAEEIASWIGKELLRALYPTIGNRLEWLEIGVDENNGQWGYCRLPWSADL
jgi:6-pyruvoyltetrahydropterin/6-carboxytetrahydropterin synthase